VDLAIIELKITDKCLVISLDSKEKVLKALNFTRNTTFYLSSYANGYYIFQVENSTYREHIKLLRNIIISL
jgi:hypothetical protein